MNRHRPVVMATNGIVASGHPLASAAGLRVIQEGGNAFDAAIAAAAVVAVTKPSMTGIGGHNLALIWDAKRQELVALDANGQAPAAATLDKYAAGIPMHGPLSASVPGTVGGWEAVLSRFGTRRLADLLPAAIGYAEQGFPVNHLLHEELLQSQEGLTHFPTSAAVFLPGGRPLGPTELLRQPDLAHSLRLIAKDGARAFYEGEIAERLGEFMAANGGLISAADLARFQPQWKEAIHTTYRGVDFYGQPPSSQGFIVGQELNIFEGYDPRAMSLSDRLHVMVEAKKLAFADRTRYLCDPDFYPVPMDQLLSKDHSARQRERIGATPAHRVKPLELVIAGGETTYLCAADGQGNAISFIQSLFHQFGSCLVAGDTGILLNDRMLGFTNGPGHPNAVEPFKRPVITLNTCMLFRDGRPWVVYGTPGADAQVQTNFQHAVNWIDFGMDVQEGIEAPRWRHLPDDKLLVETRYGAEAIDGLAAKGHELAPANAWERETGGAQAIMIDPRTGVLQGGADPRREGYAVGF